MFAKQILWPTIAAAVSLVVLLGLGTWQMQRLAWKNDLIMQIEARAQAAPVSLDAAIAQWRESGDVEYLRIRFDGRFLNNGEAHLFTTHKGRTGWRVIAPFQSGDHIVLVDRGFVPDQLKSPDKRAAGNAKRDWSIVGLARASQAQGLFVPDNDPAANSWFWRDLSAMGTVLLATGEAARLVPFFVEAEAGEVPGGWPKGGVTRLALTNKHLEYALTWYGLAVTLLFVFGFFIRSRLRSPEA